MRVKDARGFITFRLAHWRKWAPQSATLFAGGEFFAQYKTDAVFASTDRNKSVQIREDNAGIYSGKSRRNTKKDPIGKKDGQIERKTGREDKSDERRWTYRTQHVSNPHVYRFNSLDCQPYL